MQTELVREFMQQPLRVHSFLAGVPLRTLYRLELPGGRPKMTLREIRAATESSQPGEFEAGPVTKALFWLRGLIGQVLHWDDDQRLTAAVTYLERLSAEERARSLIPPGHVEGISRVLYCFENEFLAEIVNHTVHCFWLLATERTSNGYNLYLAVYVKKLNWFTPVYMALVTPLLKGIIYPSMLKHSRKRWAETFPPAVHAPEKVAV
ncbi:MAG: DUF2867 domain-containing protein [Acidobacteria bacterium]|nr:DUF2867 domain-containing protein [Acidobacteriota bacterium]MBI3424999.1 DUF2867 domain-containing protein [Acidobacteriota bacterium]